MLVESWIHVEIDRETDRDDLKEIAADLRRVLSDVRESVEDWAKMRQAALSIADDLGENPPPLPEQETSEAQKLMRWLSDDHFTFLGYREYELTTEGGPRTATRRTCSSPSPAPGSASCAPTRSTRGPTARTPGTRPPRLAVLQPAVGRRPRQGP